MADLNALIAQGAQFKAPPDPFAQYAKMQQLRVGENQNALAQYQLGSAMRTDLQKNALNKAYSDAIDPISGKIDYNKVTKFLAASNAAGQTPAELKSQAEFRKSENDSAKADADLLDVKLKQSRQFLDTINPTDPTAPARYLAWHEANHKDSIIGPALAARGVTADQARQNIEAAIAKGPEAFAQLLNQSKLGTEKFMEMNKSTLTSQNLGGTARVLSTPGLGGNSTTVPGSVGTVTTTPAQIEANRIRAGRLTVSEANLKVAQDRLANEAATGVLSSDSLEFAANLYLQTGTLPSMGIGKGGAAIKAAIMNRAAEISKNSGETSATGAGNIVSAKQNIATQTKALKDFSTGVQGQMVTSFNTAIDHLSTMDKLADALNNGDIKAISSIGNTVAKQTGSPAPTNFDAARHIVGAEIQKAIIRAGGTGRERQEAADAFNTANSPAQLKGVIETYKQLLGGQLNSLEMQYSANTNRKDFRSKLSPAAKQVLSKLRGENSGGVDTSNPLLK